MSEPYEPPTLGRRDTTVKRAFIPKLDALIFSDYSQIEYRFLAYYLSVLGYPEMAEMFKAGLDPHTEIAKALLEKEEITAVDRDFGKTFNFGSIYMAGAFKLKEMLAGVGREYTFPEALRLHETFYQKNPGIRKLSWPPPRKHRDDWSPGMMERVLETRGYIINLWGRELTPEEGYKGLNYLIQGSAADLLRASIVKVHDELTELESHLVLPVHDELIIDAKESEIDYITSNIGGWMSDDRIASVVPVEVEIEISRTNWAEKEVLENGG